MKIEDIDELKDMDFHGEKCPSTITGMIVENAQPCHFRLDLGTMRMHPRKPISKIRISNEIIEVRLMRDRWTYRFANTPDNTYVFISTYHKCLVTVNIFEIFRGSLTEWR